MVGTIDYMAPEQIEGGEVERADGRLRARLPFYQCVTGRVPYDRESEAAVLWAHMKEDFEPASQVRPGLPAAPRRRDRQGDGEEPRTSGSRRARSSSAPALRRPKPGRAGART